MLDTQRFLVHTYVNCENFTSVVSLFLLPYVNLSFQKILILTAAGEWYMGTSPQERKKRSLWSMIRLFYWSKNGNFHVYSFFFLFQFKVKERISILFRWLQSPYILPLAPISSYFFSRVSKSRLQTCFETNNASVSCKPFTKAVDYYYTAVVISNQSLGWLVVN